MGRLFSIASWNVEHFGQGKAKDPARVARVVGFLAEHDPDLFALYEVEGKHVFDALVSQMPGYTFQITEGDQTQEILVGVRRNLTAFITQKIEYKSGTTHMRPGQLVTLRIGEANYAILFLHVASGVAPRGMGLRDDMIDRALDFRKTLAAQDRRNGGDGRVRYMFLGDLNCMGLDYPFDREITAELELRNWDQKAGRGAPNRMTRLAKTHANSWSNGSRSRIPDSNLDHVYATETIRFRALGDDGAQVRVTGWTDQPDDAAKNAWIHDFSDHALLYLEVSD